MRKAVISIEEIVGAIADTAIENRARWDRLDAAVADGDFGTTMYRGFSSVRDMLATAEATSTRALLTAVSETLSEHMGGSSGPMWAVSFLRAAQCIDEHGSTPTGIACSLRGSVDAIQLYGGAKLGDKTLLDALIPATEAIEAAAKNLSADTSSVAADIALAAQRGAESTREMHARRGRSAYIGLRSVGHIDPGAAAIAELASVVAQLLGGDVDVPTYTTDATALDDESTPEEAPPTKQFINSADAAATESLAGFAAAHADLVVWNPDTRILVRRTMTDGQVGLVAGGGSGHEPLHGGYIGYGMLSAVAPGPVFASPTVHQIYQATLAADTGSGVVHLIKNYTGDVINFGIAAEMSAEQGVSVERVIIDDDVGAIADDHGVGRRGTGATIFVEKIAGAAAQAGRPQAHVVAVAQRVVDQSASFGIALGSCSPPGRSPILSLGTDEIEVGVGIHGEPGRRQDRIAPARELVAEAVTSILDVLQPSGSSRLLVLVSGLGATTLMEQYIVYGELDRQVRTAGHSIERSLVGPYLTALNMAGILLTITVLDDELVELWDCPVHTVALRWNA